MSWMATSSRSVDFPTPETPSTKVWLKLSMTRALSMASGSPYVPMWMFMGPASLPPSTRGLLGETAGHGTGNPALSGDCGESYREGDHRVRKENATGTSSFGV